MPWGRGCTLKGVSLLTENSPLKQVMHNAYLLWVLSLSNGSLVVGLEPEHS